MGVAYSTDTLTKIEVVLDKLNERFEEKLGDNGKLKYLDKLEHIDTTLTGMADDVSQKLTGIGNLVSINETLKAMATNFSERLAHLDKLVNINEMVTSIQGNVGTKLALLDKLPNIEQKIDAVRTDVLAIKESEISKKESSSAPP